MTKFLTCLLISIALLWAVFPHGAGRWFAQARLAYLAELAR